MMDVFLCNFDIHILTYTQLTSGGTSSRQLTVWGAISQQGGRLSALKTPSRGVGSGRSGDAVVS